MDDRAPSEPAAQSPANEAARAAPQEDERHTHSSRWLIAGIPVAIAVLSFALSLYIWYDGNRPPAIELTLPDRVRVTQGHDSAWLYIQPRFFSTSESDRIDGIAGIDVSVTLSADDEPATFEWDEQGTWAFNQAARSLTWQWVADPGPLVVSPAVPQQPVGLFMAPDGWYWQAGEYLVTVTAETTVSDEVLSQTSLLTLDENTVAQLNESPASLFLTIDLLPS